MFEPYDLESLLRRLGEQIAVPASRVLSSTAATAEARAELEAIESLGVQLQSLARVIGGHGQQAPERIDLGLAMVQARAERGHELEQQGASIDGPPEGLEVRASAGVLKQALELALDHALTLGRHLSAGIVQRGEPPLPTLELAAALPFDEMFGASPEALDELHWTLLAVLCHSCGIRLERQVEAQRVVLRLGFVPA